MRRDETVIPKTLRDPLTCATAVSVVGAMSLRLPRTCATGIRNRITGSRHHLVYGPDVARSDVFGLFRDNYEIHPMLSVSRLE